MVMSNVYCSSYELAIKHKVMFLTCIGLTLVLGTSRPKCDFRSK